MFLLFVLLLAPTLDLARASTDPFPQAECTFSPFPSPDGNPLSTFDGSFESFKPLSREFVSVSSTLMIGCICKKDFEGPVLADPLNGLPVGGVSILNDEVCNRSCVETADKFGFLPDSESFFSAPDGPAPRLVAFTITGETLSVERPNLQFYLAFEDASAGAESYDIRISHSFVEVFDSRTVNAFQIPLTETNSLNDTDCGSTKWAKFSISLAGLLRQDEFANVNFSLRTSQIAIALLLGDQQAFALDNVELVGPPLTNQSQIDVLALPELQTQLKASALSILGEEPLDSFFAVLAILSLVTALVLTGVTVASKSRERAEFIVKGFAFAWLGVSTALTIYAVVEYFDFVEEVGEFDLASQALAAEVQQILQVPGFDPRQLQVITDGQAVYGAYALPLPRIDRSQFLSVFESQSGSREACEQSRLSGGSCVDTADEFFEFLNTTARLDESTIASRNWAVLTVEGTVTPSQEHFLPLLLASLVFDIIVTLLLVVGILLTRSCEVNCGGARRKSRLLEAVFTGINLCLVVALLIFALSEPIRYGVSMNLIDYRYKVGVNVVPKRELLLTDGLGGLKLDSSGIGNVDACFTGTPSVKSALFSLYFEGLVFGSIEELAPGTVGTDRETCAWSETTAFTRGDGAACLTLDCSSGVLQLVQPEAVEPLYNFVVSEVIFGIILVDLLISLVDVCVLFQVAIVQRLGTRDTTEMATKLEAK